MKDVKFKLITTLAIWAACCGALWIYIHKHKIETKTEQVLQDGMSTAYRHAYQALSEYSTSNGEGLPIPEEGDPPFLQSFSLSVISNVNFREKIDFTSTDLSTTNKDVSDQSSSLRVEFELDRASEEYNMAGYASCIYGEKSSYVKACRCFSQDQMYSYIMYSSSIFINAKVNNVFHLDFMTMKGTWIEIVRFNDGEFHRYVNFCEIEL